MEVVKKVTVNIPSALLARAQKATGTGITPTIRQGLELAAAGQAYRSLRGLRGKLKIDIDLSALREDRI